MRKENVIKLLADYIKKIKIILKNERTSYTPIYRVVDIDQDETSDYSVIVQVIRKPITFTMKPEEILKDDHMVNLFSPTDIRNLTYLGYLGINAPKYKILAKQLSESSDQVIFAIHKKGDKKFKVATASEISNNQEILHGLSQEDAHMIGFTTASEQASLFDKQKNKEIEK